MRSALAAFVVLSLSACATPTVVQVVKPGDAGLTCPQLQNEYADAQRFRQEADSDKGVTGGNAARLLLFWPAILGTYSNANEAIAAAQSREVHLANLMNQKKDCPIPGGLAPVPESPVTAQAPAASQPAVSVQAPTGTQPNANGAPAN